MPQLILFEAVTSSKDSAGDESQISTNSRAVPSATVICDLLQVSLDNETNRAGVGPVVSSYNSGNGH